MPRVMLVDDDHDAVYSFKVVLELNGYDVDGFTDPYLALRNFSGGLYDLIFVDMKMPNLEGFKLFSLLKRKDYNANICFVTAGEIQFLNRNDLPYEVDSNRFLRKPVSNADLLDYAGSLIKYSKGLVTLAS